MRRRQGGGRKRKGMGKGKWEGRLSGDGREKEGTRTKRYSKGEESFWGK